MPPSNFLVTSMSHQYLNLSWELIPRLSVNGIMRNFSVSCAGILANESLHLRDEIVPFDANGTETEYTFPMVHLFPHTMYNCSIKGCTTPGCGVTTPGQFVETQEFCK